VSYFINKNLKKKVFLVFLYQLIIIYKENPVEVSYFINENLKKLSS